MFNDLRIRLEQFMQENGRYPASLGDAGKHPGADPTSNKVALRPFPQAWEQLRVRTSGEEEVYCSYTWVTGQAGAAAGGASMVEELLQAPPPPDPDDPPPPPPIEFQFVVPATTDWYYLLAKCNMDNENNPAGDAGFSWYFASSVDPEIQKRNEGR